LLIGLIVLLFPFVAAYFIMNSHKTTATPNSVAKAGSGVPPQSLPLKASAKDDPFIYEISDWDPRTPGKHWSDSSAAGKSLLERTRHGKSPVIRTVGNYDPWRVALSSLNPYEVGVPDLFADDLADNLVRFEEDAALFPSKYGPAPSTAWSNLSPAVPVIPLTGAIPGSRPAAIGTGTLTSVPEPASVALVLSGLALLYRRTLKK
jgi:hypothetical protein